MKRGKYRKAVFIATYHLEDKVPKFLIQKPKLHWKGFEFPKGGIEKFEFKKNAIRKRGL